MDLEHTNKATPPPATPPPKAMPPPAQPSLPAQPPPPSIRVYNSPTALLELPSRRSNSKEKIFKLHPLFTMKRLDLYPHTPKGELLTTLAKSRYEENLEDIIHPALWTQIDPKSLEIFSNIAYMCLEDKRGKRPTIDQIFTELEEALNIQEKKSKPTGEVEETSNRWKGGPLEELQIPLEDIQKATKNFSNEYYLGDGGFGKVYYAELELSIKDKATGEISTKRTEVAIKCITESQGKQGFLAEIELLTSCKHTNIISLLGFCDDGPNMILVYEYAYNGSLDTYLENPRKSTNLVWVQRIKLAIDIARGLLYLHTMETGDEQSIVHRDIKSGNILLSKNLVGKIADFGLSRLYINANKQEESVYTGVVGTNVYLCPEYKVTNKLKRSVDIYSFGVVLFEIVSGKLAYDQTYTTENESGIAYVARRRYKERTLHEMVDHKIMEEVDESTSTNRKGPNENSLRTYLHVAYQCLAEAQADRPTANAILEELEKALSLQIENNDNLQMSFEAIKSATENFIDMNLIGGGGFGKVYKGKMQRDNGSSTIVAKRLDRKQGQGEQHFLMELEILFDYKHENIIGLEGYCNERHEKIIVYEYASNGSLNKHLGNLVLTWTKRLKICIDVVRGLTYLHGGAGTKEMVIHRDIKSANILLNDDWKAKISDFGLSAIIPINHGLVSGDFVGTDGYYDPLYKIAGFFSEKSDIYSLGVVLFEILYGKLLVRTNYFDQKAVSSILERIHGNGELGWVVFKGIRQQIDPKSLSTFREIVSKCIAHERDERPTAKEVLQQLEKSLEFQEEYEIWGPKLPKDYEDIFKLSTYSGNYSTKMKKELYNVLSEGILLQDGKVWFSLGANGERNEMISARTFTYTNCSPLDKWCIVPESRFQKVAKMLDISNLMIEISTKTQFLSPDTEYGVHLVFKFCDPKNLSRIPMYVDLKYKEGSESLHAYYANWRDDNWMMIELYRFQNLKEDVVLKFLLESLSHCRDDAIYVEGIEFRVIKNARRDVTKKPKEIKQVVKSNLNVGQLQSPIEIEEIFKRSENYDRELEKLLSPSEVNGKKHLMLSAKAVLHNFSDNKFFKPLADPRFQEVFELFPQLIFRISCTIKSQMLSQDTEYVCYLVFKLSEKCQGLHCPVEVQDLLYKNEAPEIVYFETPRPWNIHDNTRVPKQRKDGCMEVNVLKLNSNHELKNDFVQLNLKLVSYEGLMSGLIICGLEFRPM